MRHEPIQTYADLGIPPSPQDKAQSTGTIGRATRPASTGLADSAMWDLMANELGTVKVQSYEAPVIVISAPSEAREAYSAVDAAVRELRGAAPVPQFTVRRDFDCGRYVNAWSLYVVRPNGQHISNLQFGLDEEDKAQAIADAMNQALTAEVSAVCAPVERNADSTPASPRDRRQLPDPANIDAWPARSQGGAQ
jgi:hypothetical protein